MIYVVGDLHGSYDGSMKYLNTKNFPEQKTMTKDDLVICLGDFGFWFNEISTKEDTHWRNWMMDKNFQMCFISGNHENHPLIDREFTDITFYGAKAQEYTSEYGKIIHIKFGEVLNYNGTKILCVGKAQSQDKAYRKEYIDWWKEEEPSRAEYENALSCLEGNTIDYVISHTAPYRVIKPMFNIADGVGKSTDIVSNFHEELLKNGLTCEEWHFGHFHENKKYCDNAIDFYCHYKSAPFLLEMTK